MKISFAANPSLFNSEPVQAVQALRIITGIGREKMAGNGSFNVQDLKNSLKAPGRPRRKIKRSISLLSVEKVQRVGSLEAQERRLSPLLIRTGAGSGKIVEMHYGLDETRNRRQAARPHQPRQGDVSGDRLHQRPGHLLLQKYRALYSSPHQRPADYDEALSQRRRRRTFLREKRAVLHAGLDKNL